MSSTTDLGFITVGAGNRCAGGRPPSSLLTPPPAPFFPLIRQPAYNAATYFVVFNVEFGPGRVVGGTLITAAATAAGAPVLLRVPSTDPPCPAPWTTAAVTTIVVQAGTAAIPTGAPVTMTVNNGAAAGPSTTFVLGCTEATDGSGTLTYALPGPGVPSLSTPAGTNLVLTAPVGLSTLETATNSCLFSQDGRAVVAVPVLGAPASLQLRLQPLGSGVGYPVVSVKLLSSDQYPPPCPYTSPGGGGGGGGGPRRRRPCCNGGVTQQFVGSITP